MYSSRGNNEGVYSSDGDGEERVERVCVETPDLSYDWGGKRRKNSAKKIDGVRKNKKAKKKRSGGLQNRAGMCQPMIPAVYQIRAILGIVPIQSTILLIV